MADLEAHIPGLRRFARALLRGDRTHADDLVQDTLERAISRWHQRRGNGDLRAWVYTILYNRFLSDRARRLRRQEWSSSLTAIREDDWPVVDGGQEQSLAYSDVMRSFSELPEDQRAVLMLVGVDEFAYEEAARILDIPIGTVMSRLSRARERLRECLDWDEGRAQPSPATSQRREGQRPNRQRLALSVVAGRRA